MWKAFKSAAAVAGVAALTSLSLIVTAVPAQAYAPPVDPQAPPRTSTTAPKPVVKTPTTPVIPKNIASRVFSPVTGAEMAVTVNDWLAGSLGLPGRAGDAPGSMCVDQRLAVACGGSATKPATAEPQQEVMPDWLWNFLTKPIPSTIAWFTGQTTPPPNSYGVRTMTITGVDAATGKVTADTTHQNGTFCDNSSQAAANPQVCDGSQEDGGTFNLWGRCKANSTGTMYGLNGNSTLNAEVGNGYFDIGERKGSAISGRPLCPTGQTLQWVKWKDNPSGGFFSGHSGMFNNPAANVNHYANTKINSEVKCGNSSGATVTVTDSSTGTGVVPKVSCPAGYQPIGGSTSIASDLLEAPKKLEEWSITPTTREQYQDCIGWQSKGCVLTVQLDGVDCTPATPQCHNWAEIHRLQPSRIKCKWGNYDVDISHCLPLRNAFLSESGLTRDKSALPRSAWWAVDSFGNLVQPNSDPNGAPYHDPNWNPNTGPAPGSDPVTWPQPGTPNYPNTSPTNPGTGTGTQTPTFPTTGTNPAGTNCGATWNWNPWDWVGKQLHCAFIPTVDMGDRSDGLRDLALTKPPLSWTPVMTGPGGGGCPDWTVHIPGVMSKNVVCDSSFTAAIVAARGPMFGLLTAAMLWPLFRSIWYACIPFLRVTPSK